MKSELELRILYIKKKTNFELKRNAEDILKWAESTLTTLDSIKKYICVHILKSLENKHIGADQSSLKIFCMEYK